LCGLVEEIDGGCSSGILLYDSIGKGFQRGGASSLCSKYIDALHDLFGTSESLPQPAVEVSRSTVTVADVEAETRWPAWRRLSLAHGIGSSWSTPILSRTDDLLGTFAIYRTEPGTPTPRQCDLVHQLTHIARIAIERTSSDTLLQRTLEAFRAIVETTPESVT